MTYDTLLLAELIIDTKNRIYTLQETINELEGRLGYEKTDLIVGSNDQYMG